MCVDFECENRGIFDIFDGFSLLLFSWCTAAAVFFAKNAPRARRPVDESLTCVITNGDGIDAVDLFPVDAFGDNV